MFLRHRVHFYDLAPPVRNFTCSNDGMTLLCLHKHGISLYDLRHGYACPQLVRTIHTPRTIRYISAVTFVRENDTFLLLSNETMTLYEFTSSGDIVRMITVEHGATHICSDGVYLVATNCDENVHVYDYATLTLVHAFEGVSYLDKFRDACFLSPGRVAVSNFSLDAIHVFDLQTGACTQTICTWPRPWHICYDPILRTMFVYCLCVQRQTSPKIAVIQMTTGKCIDTLPLTNKNILSFGMASGGGKVFLWNQNKPKYVEVFTHAWDSSRQREWLLLCL